ncbi:MAG TPA: crosslink repair DNA glycosylase YcaQ family protein, partial [Ktedonobacterales bacterium]|nr:crosslink repair DNA glycosylase YcaQ family protein [Ktedonobacterales bacterium]
EVRQALRLVEGDFERAQIDGQVYWFSRAASQAAAPERSAWLLPAYDELTVAYADRRAMLDPAFPDDAFTILGPVIVVDGRLVGSWKRTLAKDAVTLSMTLYAPLDGERRAAIAEAAERYGRFLGLPVKVETRSARD